MKNALLLFLLSLIGAPAPGPSTVEPAASISTMAASAPVGRTLRVEEVLGAWRGRWESADGASVPVEVVISNGARPRTVFAYVTLAETSGERTLRRPGRLSEAGLEFDVPGRGAVVLRADGAARLVAPGVTLVRLRQ